MLQLRNQARLRAVAVALSATAFGLTTGCSSLQQLGAPSDGSHFYSMRGAGIPKSGDPARDHVVQILEERAPNLEDRDRERVIDAIFSASQQHGLEPSLLLALMQVESSFNPSARSSKGAIGLMQVIPFSGRLMARELGIEWQGNKTLLDPEQNIRIGAAYLARMRETFSDIEVSLAAYNAGPGRIQDLLDSGRRPAGIYAKKVVSRQAEIASLSLPTTPATSTASAVDTPAVATP
jgi:soluble lytic murein transglycosylase-like protein